MANRITDFTGLTVPTANDVFAIVDVLDTTQSAQGTTKKISFANLQAGLSIAGSQITGVVPVAVGGTGVTTSTGTGSAVLSSGPTLTGPIISQIVNTGTLTLPTTTDTLVGRATTDTLTNKTLTAPFIKQNIISGQGATATLTAAQTYSTCLFDRAAGIIYTLPAPSPGLVFTFIVTTTITSNNAKIITDAGTTLLIGDVTLHKDSDGTQLGVFGNGSTHLAVTMNGTTTGGIIGTQLTFTCVTATIWNVTGTIHASGTIATPFATS